MQALNSAYALALAYCVDDGEVMHRDSTSEPPDKDKEELSLLPTPKKFFLGERVRLNELALATFGALATINTGTIVEVRFLLGEWDYQVRFDPGESKLFYWNESYLVLA